MTVRRNTVPLILQEPPTGIQLEILSRQGFSEFVLKRYRSIGNTTFERRMERAPTEPH